MEVVPKIKKEKKNKIKTNYQGFAKAKAPFRRNDSDLWLQAIVGCPWQEEETMFAGWL